MLELDEDIQVVGEAGTGEEALALIASLPVNIVLLDIKLPGMDGIEVIRKAKVRQPDLKIIVFSSYGEEYLTQAIEAGATGYLLKRVSRNELIRAIHMVHEEQSPLDPSLSRELFTKFASLAMTNQGSTLSNRQLEILRQLASGVTNKEVAAQLFISESTVRREIVNMFNKLGVNDRAHAVSEAYIRKLIPLPD